MPRTIRARITLGISALVLMVLLVLSGAVWLLLSRELHQMVDRTLTLGVNQLIPMAELEDGRLHLEKRDDGHAEAPIGPEDLVRLVSADQRVLDSRGSTGVPLDPQALRPRLNLTTVRREDATLMRVATAPVLDQGRVLAYLQVGHSLTDVEQTLGKVRLWLAVLVPLCLGLSALGSYRLAVSALAPVEAIRSQAARTEIEALETGMPIDLPDDEVGRLARTFDQMLKRLAASYAKQKRFTADASHELRTPVSVIRGVAEVALANKRTDEEYRSALATIVNESQSMSRLIGDLLFLARADSSGLRLELETLDLAEVLPALDERLSESGPAVTFHLQRPLMVRADKDRLLQIVWNLLDNARVHAPGSPLTIRGERRDGKVLLAFEDQGPGIAPEHLPHLTKRFYRADPARNRRTGSSGLGLAISEELARAHQGAISIESVEGRGTTILVELPAI